MADAFWRGEVGVKLRVRQMDQKLVMSVRVEDDYRHEQTRDFDGENRTSAMASTAFISRSPSTYPPNRKLTVRDDECDLHALANGAFTLAHNECDDRNDREPADGHG